jgi:orotate phosphoribosyltransferase
MSNSETARKTAEFLLQINAIKLQPANPFQWASGWLSPIYCDNRKILSYPNIRKFIRDALTEIVKTNFPNVEVIAGVATGGIAQGALVAQELDLPFVYVRSSSKGHGLQNQVEGVVEKGQRVVVIEDLISTGMSSLNAVKALENIGCKVLGMSAIFTYGFDAATSNFAQHHCTLLPLCDYHELIEQAVKGGYISDGDVASLQEWRSHPDQWKQP